MLVVMVEVTVAVVAVVTPPFLNPKFQEFPALHYKFEVRGSKCNFTSFGTIREKQRSQVINNVSAELR